MAKKAQNVFQFKITLDGVKPAIWRRIQVPETSTFWDLHVAIQDAMGWFDCHLHQFEIISPETSEECMIGIPDEDGWGDASVLAGWKEKISSYFSATNNKASYDYDFGDSWEHRILLEKIIPVEPGVKYPLCLAGERACPPEDCGGIWGYEELLELMKNPDHEEYEERLEWLGGDFDPEDFTPGSARFDDPKKRLKLAGFK